MIYNPVIPTETLKQEILNAIKHENHEEKYIAEVVLDKHPHSMGTFDNFYAALRELVAEKTIMYVDYLDGFYIEKLDKEVKRTQYKGFNIRLVVWKCGHKFYKITRWRLIIDIAHSFEGAKISIDKYVKEHTNPKNGRIDPYTVYTK